jgi:tetratricopeptide (TPR) repeat protein
MKGQDFIRKWDLGGNGQYLKLAINNFEEALKIDPDYIAAFMGKAQALVKSGSYDSSKIYCKKVLAIDKENAYALGGLGAYYLYTVNPDSALFFLQKSNENLINDENQFWNYLAIGQIYLCQKNDLIYALQSFQKAYESGGDSWPEIHENIALIFSSSADYSKAFGYMLNALSMTSGCVYVQKSSSILLASQRYNEAKNFIDSIARITPCDQICDVMRFHMYTLQKEFDKADVFLNKAVNSGYILLKDDYFYKYCLDKGIGRGSVCLPEIRSIVSGEEKLFETGKYYWVGESALRIAAGYTILGDKRKALTYLKKLEELVFTDTAFPLNSFPGFDNLRNDPEFKAITERIESKRSSLRKMVRELQLQGEVRL